MKIIWTVACAIQLVLFTSCATQYLWRETDPAEYVALSQSTVSQQDLERRHLHFIVDDEKDVFYVEKNGIQKLRDYTIRTLGTPVAVTIDAAATIVVIGIGIAVLPYYNQADAQRCERAREDKEYDRVNRVLDDVRMEQK